MHEYVTRYKLLGIRVPHGLYRRVGRFVPYRFRDVSNVPAPGLKAAV
jgi:hypothetical protein